MSTELVKFFNMIDHNLTEDGMTIGLLSAYEKAPERVTHIPHDKFSSLLTKNLYRLMAAVNAYGFELRIVGGAVRDLLVDRKPRDIDLVTDARPDEIMFILTQNEIEFDSWGISHGTVKAEFDNGEEFEITARDFRIYDENGVVTTHNGNSWEEDAQARDVTLNALSMDLNGNVYDYVGGYQDLLSRRIRIIGNAGSRLELNPRLIIRWFKALAQFKDAGLLRSDLDAIKQRIGLVASLPADWIKKALTGLNEKPAGRRVREIMTSLGLSEIIDTILSEGYAILSTALIEADRASWSTGNVAVSDHDIDAIIAGHGSVQIKPQNRKTLMAIIDELTPEQRRFIHYYGVELFQHDYSGEWNKAEQRLKTKRPRTLRSAG